MDAADANDDGGLTVADPIYILAYLFGGGPGIKPPFEAGGADPTDDALSFEVFPQCPK